ncbi:hypothetical protein THAOC_19310 [Thalassiosira oceanica]|uniref:Uncharacterized protein n=1 Tax=Thalassiosira oceanica TaxID=159749 RepID=K0SH74_THAOC|nr:hypothetical protein THAOC_19310 [Thalassiosira oceanica]|eukprot:EJK60351.1 hypothetical protein THAOC_19310 [Thalassiosira oceanica]
MSVDSVTLASFFMGFCKRVRLGIYYDREQSPKNTRPQPEASRVAWARREIAARKAGGGWGVDGVVEEIGESLRKESTDNHDASHAPRPEARLDAHRPAADPQDPPPGPPLHRAGREGRELQDSVHPSALPRPPGHPAPRPDVPLAPRAGGAAEDEAGSDGLPPRARDTRHEPAAAGPPRTPVHIRKKIANERKRQRERAKKARRKAGLDGDEPELPKMDDLVRSYLGRREASYRRSNEEPARGRQDEEYYNKLLLDRARDADDDVKTRFLSPSSLTTAMGRKAVMVENAYAFALRQQEEMIAAGRQGRILTEEESRARVEEILGREASENRREGHEAAKGV